MGLTRRFPWVLFILLGLLLPGAGTAETVPVARSSGKT